MMNEQPAFTPVPITAGQVRELRERTGMGMVQAKKQLLKEGMQASLDKLCAEGTHEDKIDWMLRRVAEMAGLTMPAEQKEENCDDKHHGP